MKRYKNNSENNLNYLDSARKEFASFSAVKKAICTKKNRVSNFQMFTIHPKAILLIYSDLRETISETTLG